MGSGTFKTDNWGPFVWAAIHIVAMGAPKELSREQRQQYAAFYNNIAHVLPCNICNEHFQKKLKETPVEQHTGSRQDLFEWTVDMHNSVNHDTGKTPQIDHTDAFNYWKRVCLGEADVVTKERSKQTQNSLMVWKFLTAILCLFLMVMMYKLYCKSGSGPSARGSRG
jgi:hypothetical protein